MSKITFLILIFVNVAKGHLHLEWEPRNPPFDYRLYEDLLDHELCQDQLRHLAENDTELRLQFLESGLRIPKGFTQGNLEDWGIYHKCIGISKEISDSIIEGKYCFIRVFANQNIERNLPSWVDFDPNQLVVDNKTIEYIQKYKHIIGRGNQRTAVIDLLDGFSFKLALCLPKPCTTYEALDGLYNLGSIGYYDMQCRVKNNKQWVPAYYVAIGIFSLIGLITLLSTGYDIWHSILLKTDPKTIKPICKSFSLYTNTRQVLTFTKNPNALECVDGVRALAMVWVILGHSVGTTPPSQNVFDARDWAASINSLWIYAAPISVDTFFLLSGMLLVYTTAGKMTGMKLIKNLHLFYLNRLLRMFPLLAAAILLQASVFFWIADGPVWDVPAMNTEDCRNYWWSTLLYVFNYVNIHRPCIPHAWYLAIDMQLHILSPLVLFWVLSGKKTLGWIAIITGLMAFLISSTAYNYIKELPSNSFHYLYYHNTLTRASPFFVGMIFGYLLHLHRGQNVKLSKVIAIFLWMITFTVTSLVVYSYHVVRHYDWDNKIADGLINSFSRAAWAAGIGWIIFACQHGYGGPINWILSLQMWKLISRLSYGMYIFHLLIMYITAGTAVAPVHFSVTSMIYRFIAEFVIAFVVSFVMTVFIDAPFSTITKLVLGGGPKKPREEKNKNETFTNEHGLNREISNDNTITDQEKLVLKM